MMEQTIMTCEDIIRMQVQLNSLSLRMKDLNMHPSLNWTKKLIADIKILHETLTSDEQAQVHFRQRIEDLETMPDSEKCIEQMKAIGIKLQELKTLIEPNSS